MVHIIIHRKHLAKTNNTLLINKKGGYFKENSKIT